MAEWTFTAWIQANGTLLGWLAIASAIGFVTTLVLVPLLIVRIPADYFSNPRRQIAPWSKLHPVLRIVLLFSKNMLGLVFLLLGIAMLALPGQGVLTILLGIILLDFPGKYTLEKWLVGHKPVIQTINWLRQRANKPLLIVTTGIHLKNTPDH